MVEFASIFSNFKLPPPTTWFYFSLLMAVALFFKFTRLLSVRNWDVLMLFLLVPGLLLLQDARKPASAAETVAPPPPDEQAVSAEKLDTSPTLPSKLANAAAAKPTAATTRSRLLWFGYLWLL